MGFCHSDYMESDEWQVVRDIVLRLDNYECQVCLWASIHNQVHHTTYDNVGTVDEIKDCFTLCGRHHQGIHNSIRYLKDKEESKILKYINKRRKK